MERWGYSYTLLALGLTSIVLLRQWALWHDHRLVYLNSSMAPLILKHDIVGVSPNLLRLLLWYCRLRIIFTLKTTKLPATAETLQYTIDKGPVLMFWIPGTTSVSVGRLKNLTYIPLTGRMLAWVESENPNVDECYDSRHFGYLPLSFLYADVGLVEDARTGEVKVPESFIWEAEITQVLLNAPLARATLTRKKVSDAQSED